MTKQPASPKVVLGRLRRMAAESPASAFRHFFRLLFHPLVSWETVYFFERDLTRLQVREIKARVPLSIRETSKVELRGFPDFLAGAGKTWERMEERFDRGDHCFLALSNGRLVHFSWLTSSLAWIPELRVNLRLGAGEAYIYDSFTETSQRGQGIQPAVASFVLRYELASGYSRHILYVNRRNIAGLRVLDKVAEPRPVLVRAIRCFRFAGFKGSLLTGLGAPGSLLFEPAQGAHPIRFGRLGQWMPARG